MDRRLALARLIREHRMTHPMQDPWALADSVIESFGRCYPDLSVADEDEIFAVALWIDEGSDTVPSVS